jgi:ferredoxin
MDRFRYLENVATLQLDRERCIGCRRCVEVCPHGVFTLQDGRAWLLDREACMECGACARNCPPTAILVDSGVGCASGLITEWLQAKKLGWKSPGC